MTDYRIPTPNFVLNTPVTITTPSWGKDPLILPEGSYVRPIEERYLPQHILEDYKHRFFNPLHEIYVYSKLGIVIVPINALRSV